MFKKKKLKNHETKIGMSNGHYFLYGNEPIICAEIF
jgi:hypothetical protein